MRKRRIFAAAAALPLAIAGMGVAYADNIVNDVNVAAGDNSIAIGGSTTIAYKVNGAGSDGCNAADGTSLTIALGVPANVTASATSLTFNACNVWNSVSFSASVPGDYQITVRTMSDAGGIADYSNKADWTLHVAGAANTKPSVAVMGVADGAEYVIGAVPSAMCDVTDVEQPTEPDFAAELSGVLDGDGLGQQTATCDFTDDGGLAADTAAVTYTIVAPPNEKPIVAVTGVTNGAEYEYGTAPAAGCAVTDAEDGSSTVAPVITGTLSHGLGSQTVTCDATDTDGAAADTVAATYTIVDTVDPTITHAVSGTKNSNGWYKTDVTVTFTCADLGSSGIDTCLVDGESSNAKTLGEGANQSVSGTATDWGGNKAHDTASGINIDETAPVITDDSASTEPAGTTGANGWYTTNVAVTFKAIDNLSGFSGEASPYTFTRSTSGEGSAVTVSSGTVDDLAGNTSNSVTSDPFKVDLYNPTVSCGTAPTFVLNSSASVSATVGDTARGSGPVAQTATATANTSSIGSKTVVITGYDNAGRSGTATCSYNVVYDWTGFFQPVDNNALNSVKAGSAIPVKFNLGGNQGLNILAVGSPSSKVITCDSTAQVDAVEETLTAGSSSLSYDSTAGHYTYVWKSDKGWAGTCRQLVVTLADGTAHRANFKFLK